MATKCFLADKERNDDYWETPGAMFTLDITGNDPNGKTTTRAVVLPDRNIWPMDQPASDGGYWAITGEAPNLTARPSIMTPTYHGWLTDGVLSDDLEGRSYAD